ncbi:MAG: hypothetical protein GY863_05950 [bacterium]|nr:hypothetical protein [bacterium]
MDFSDLNISLALTALTSGRFSIKKYIKNLKEPYPVIFADAPVRVEPDRPVPVACMIKNLENESIIIKKIKITVMKKREPVYTARPVEKEITIRSKFWHKVYYVSIPSGVNGEVEIDVTFEVGFRDLNKTFHNDSLRGTKHNPVKVFICKEPLPAYKEYCFGDLFNREYFTRYEDHDCAPLRVKADFEYAKGNIFMAASDNSFDTTGFDGENNDLTDVQKWQNFRENIESWNEKGEFIILPGELISCKNITGKNINLLILNHKKTISKVVNGKFGPVPGHTDHKLKEFLNNIGSKSISIASEAAEKASLFESLIKKKGVWNLQDLTDQGLTGIHVGIDKEYELSNNEKLKWIFQLLNGGRKAIISGSNFHDYFQKKSRFGIPVFKKSGEKSAYNNARIGIISSRPYTIDKIINSIKKGKVVVTNGPLLDFYIQNELGEKAIIGGEIEGTVFSLNYRFVSSPEFGPVKKLCLYSGDIETHKEELIYNIHFQKNNYNLYGAIDFEAPGNKSYVRGELFSDAENSMKFCLTNPIWLSERKF